MVPIEAKRGIQDPWYWSYRGLQAAMLVLGVEPRSSEKYSQCSYPLSHVYSPEFLYIKKHYSEPDTHHALNFTASNLSKTQERLLSGLYGRNAQE